MKKVSLIVLGTIFVVVGIGVLPSYSQTTIYACITKSTGQVRIVSTPGQCKSNEASIYWNQTGPQGEQGIQGIQGEQGPAGIPLGVCSDSDTKTNLLFTFVTNQSGFDTGFEISNTGRDPYGTVGQAGTCTLNFYGANEPAPITTPSIAQGTTYANLASSVAPNFQGYLIASCNFPFAHGFAFVSDLGARNLAMGYLSTNICNPRTPPQ